MTTLQKAHPDKPTKGHKIPTIPSGWLQHNPQPRRSRCHQAIRSWYVNISSLTYQALRYAGADRSAAVHPPGTLEEHLQASDNLGPVDKSTLPTDAEKQRNDPSLSTSQQPPLSSLLNLHEIESLAHRLLPPNALAYYASASDDLHTNHHNSTAFRKILLRPRIFRDVAACSLSTTLLSHKVSVPFFVSPAAMARLAHTDGERGIAEACRERGVAMVLSNNASMTPEQVVEGLDGLVAGWQLYVQTERERSERMLARINQLDAFKFVVLTLDGQHPRLPNLA